MSPFSSLWQQVQHTFDRNRQQAPAPAANSGVGRAAQAMQRARRHSAGRQFYDAANSLFHFHPDDFVAALRLIVKWSLLGGLVGVLAGTASAIFLVSLTWATQFRLDHPGLLWLLPVAGLAMGWAYAAFAGTAAQGNNLVIDEVNHNRARIPLRMAPMVLLGTVITHLFGGSAGREGTAIQMGASLADGVRRWLRLNAADRRLTLMAGISGGFGSVFGVPVAGAVFGLEVQSVGRIHYEGLIACLVASFVGDFVTRAWGVPHTHYPQLDHVANDPGLLLKVALAGTLFGLTSLLFVELTHGIKRLLPLLVKWSPLNPLIGGVAVIALTLLVGTPDYLGLSLPLIQHALDGSGVVAYAFLLKLLFTAVTLGAGFLGGEVTPLFVIGSTLGYSLGLLLGVDPTFLAAIGLVAVFAGASNTPLACTIMGIELFGGGITLYLFLGCVVAYLASGHRGIYSTQMVSIPKVSSLELLENENLNALIARRRQGWLPPLARYAGSLLQMPVRTLMATAVVAVPETATVTQVVERALASGVRSLPVLDNRQQVVGIVTDGDLQRSGLKITLSMLRLMNAQERTEILARLEPTPLSALMTRPTLTIAVTAKLQVAADLFNQQHLKRLPVVDDEGKLVGIITRSDLLRGLLFATLPDPKLPRVGELKLPPATTVTASIPLAQAIQTMRAAEQYRAVVTDPDGRALGMVTLSDLWGRLPPEERPALLATLLGNLPAGQEHLSPTVAEVMTSPLITLSPTNTVLEALQLLLEKGIKRLPVVDGEGQILGLVGRAELLRVLARPGAEETSSTPTR